MFELPESGGSQLTAFSYRFCESPEERARGVAVSDTGHVFVTDEAGVFQEVVTEVSALGPIVDVDTTAWEYSVLFASGDWWLGAPGTSAASPAEHGCFEPSEFDFLVFTGLGAMRAITPEGQSYLRTWHYDDLPEPDYLWCRASSPAVEGCSRFHSKAAAWR